MKGLIRDAHGRVIYKFDTLTKPVVSIDETIELREDIDDFTVYHKHNIREKSDMEKVITYAKEHGWIL